MAEADVFTFASPSAFAAFADSVDAARLRGLSESRAIRRDRADDRGGDSRSGICRGNYRRRSHGGGIRGGDRKIFRAEYRGENAMSFPVVRPRRLRRTEAIRRSGCAKRA